MKYLGTAIKILIMIIGLIIIKKGYTGTPNTDCLSGVAIFLIGLYLALQGKYGNDFSGCLFSKKVIEAPKKKSFFGK